MSLSERVCPVCGMPFAGQNEDGSSGNAAECTLCSQCGFLYHDECWDGIERCAVFGCRCTHAESASMSLELPDTTKCPSCGETNPYRASLCLKCGQPLEGRTVGKVFSSNSVRNKWQANDAKELILKADQDWNASVRYLYNGDFEYWLENNGYKELAQKAKQARTANRQRSVGLEVFLESTGFVEKPVLNLSSESFVIECADDEIDKAIDLTNIGRGYLYGTLQANVDWIIAQPQEFASNNQRILLTLDMTALEGNSGEGQILFKTSGGDKTVTVRANRIAVSTAIKLFRDGNFLKARAIGRKLLESRISVADASILCAACCLCEENYIGAVSDLRQLSGKCKSLPSDIVSQVYEWLKSDPPQAVTLEKDSIYEAIAEVADESVKKELNKDLARVFIDRASMSVETGSGSGSLWSSGQQASKNIKAALKQAETLDPELAKEASDVRRRLRSSKPTISLSGCLVMTILLVCLAIGGVFYLQSVKKIDIVSFGQGKSADLIGGDFRAENADLRAEFQNSPSDDNVRAKYAASLLGLAREAESSHVYSVADGYTAQALEVAKGSAYALEVTQSRMLNWVKELKENQMAGEAYIRCRQALSLGANSELEAISLELAPSWDKYYSVFEAVNGAFSCGSVVLSSSDESSRKFVQTISSFGVYFYKARVDCAYIDMTGDGLRDLIVAGCDDLNSEVVVGADEEKDKQTANSASLRNLSGSFAVYSWNKVILNQVFSQKVKGFGHLVSLTCANVTSQSKEEVIMVWNALVNPDYLNAVVVSHADKDFTCTSRAGNINFDVADHDNNGRFEIWISSVLANSTDLGNAVYVPVPYTLGDKGLVKASGNFNSLYTKIIKSLDEQIKSNPYPKDSDMHRLYRLDRQKAKDWLQERMDTKTSSAAAESGADNNKQ
ncbi:MAG: hypothetical protein ACI38Q_04525 [Candidatus Bruticola sp.]